MQIQADLDLEHCLQLFAKKPKVSESVKPEVLDEMKKQISVIPDHNTVRSWFKFHEKNVNTNRKMI
jgi:hypothetical protein